MKKNTNTVKLTRPGNSRIALQPPRQFVRPGPLQLIQDWIADARADIALVNKHFNPRPA